MPAVAVDPSEPARARTAVSSACFCVRAASQRAHAAASSSSPEEPPNEPPRDRDRIGSRPPNDPGPVPS